MIALERSPPPTRRLRTIERLQGWSMLAYYPLEHLYYLLSHSAIPDKLPLPSLTAFIPFVRTKPGTKHIPLDLGALGVWSTRFWAAYVVLQIAHLREDSKLLAVRERTISKSKVGRMIPTTVFYALTSASLDWRDSCREGGHPVQTRGIVERVHREPGLPATYRPLVRHICPFHGRILDLQGEFHSPTYITATLGAPFCCDSMRGGVDASWFRRFLFTILGGAVPASPPSDDIPLLERF